jgi:hypothetical protein
LTWSYRKRLLLTPLLLLLQNSAWYCHQVPPLCLNPDWLSCSRRCRRRFFLLFKAQNFINVGL